MTEAEYHAGVVAGLLEIVAARKSGTQVQLSREVWQYVQAGGTHALACERFVRELYSAVTGAPPVEPFEWIELI